MIAGDPDQVAAAAADLRRAGTSMDDAADTVGAHATAVTAYWSGAASGAALEGMTALASWARTGGEVFTEAEPVLLGYAAELRAAQDAYVQGQALVEVGEMSLRVLDHGLPPEALGAGNDLATAEGRIRSGGAMMTAAVGRAERAAEAAATAIDALTERLSALPASSTPLGGSSAWARLRHDATDVVTFGRDFVDGAMNNLVATGRQARDLFAGEDGAWGELGTGLLYAAAFPASAMQAAADLETLEEEGAGYWLGGFAPGAVATATGAGAAAWLQRGTMLSGPSLPGDGGPGSALKAPDVEPSTPVDLDEPLVDGGRSAAEWDERLGRVADPESVRAYDLREQYANEVYESVRANPERDIALVSEASGLTKPQVLQVYEHLFVEEHPFDDGTVRQFDVDSDIADAWRRLREGHPEASDHVLLAHEVEESTRMRANPELTYEGAHFPLQQEGPWWTPPRWDTLLPHSTERS